MKILFCLPVYQIFADRCSALALRLTSKGHEVRCIVQEGPAPSDVVPTELVNWANFEHKSIEKFSPDLIILWNGYFNYFHAAVKHLKKKYRTATMEMGWFDRGTHSYILEDLSQHSRICDIRARQWPIKARRNLDLLDETRFKYDTSRPDTFYLPKHYIFIPMQMEHDTQILYCSDSFKSMDSVIGFVKNEVPEAPIVLRNHPLEENIIRPSYAADLTPSCSSLPLALNAALVCGINSTLLAEAMLFHKPVVNLGKHVAGACFFDASMMRGLYKEISEGTGVEVFCDKEFRDKCDFWSLVLLKNQWDCNNPPEWVVDKVEERDFSPVIP